MKSKTFILSAVFLLCLTGCLIAADEHDHRSNDHAVQVEEVLPEAINVGNKICPVSREVIVGLEEGKGVQVEHKGKIYNLCCKMCAKDFKKNPEKYIEIINEELEKVVYEEPEGQEQEEGVNLGHHEEEHTREHKDSHHHAHDGNEH